MGQPYGWNVVDGMNREQFPEQVATNSTLDGGTSHMVKSLLRRSVPTESSMPLLKRSSSADLQAARHIVENAWTESQTRNKARVANPVRQELRYRSGATSSRERSRRNNTRASTGANQNLSPLLEITEDIAAAAALVAEADMKGKSLSEAKRQTAPAEGTYWMQG